MRSLERSSGQEISYQAMEVEVNSKKGLPTQVDGHPVD
jgi:hypothetical protein